VRILASPRLGPMDASEVIHATVAALDELSGRASGMGQRWAAAGTLSLERREPYATGASKILALHVLGPPRRDTRPAEPRVLGPH
jgi:hypothetical protein